MKKIIFNLILLVLVTKNSNSFGQEWSVYHSFNSMWSTASASTTSIVTDQNNVTWVGTYAGGLVKIENDVITEVFTTSNSNLVTNEILSLAVDASNILWVGTGAGLMKYDGFTFTEQLVGNGAAYVVKHISIDAQNHLWLSLLYNGVIDFDGTTSVFYTMSNSPFPIQFINKVKIDTENNKWLINNDINGGVWKLSSDSVWTHFNTVNSSLPSDNVADIAFDQNNNKWFATENGLAKFDDTNWEIFNLFNAPFITNYAYSLHFNSNNVLYVGFTSSNSGVNIASFDGQNWSDHNYNTTNTIYPNANIFAINSDQNNTIWFGGVLLYSFNSGNANLKSNQKNEFDVYPNPCSSTLFVNGLKNEVNYVIKDSQGKEIQNGKTKNLIDFQYIKKGIYYLHIENYTERILIN